MSSREIMAAPRSADATKKVLERHLGAFSKGIDAIVADHGKDSAVLTHDKQYRGLAEIRAYFDAFLKRASNPASGKPSSSLPSRSTAAWLPTIASVWQADKDTRCG